MPQRSSEPKAAPDTPKARLPNKVTLRWLSRQLVQAHARANQSGDVRLELAALNALAKLHGLNREADMAIDPGEPSIIYLPDNGRD